MIRVKAKVLQLYVLWYGIKCAKAWTLEPEEVAKPSQSLKFSTFSKSKMALCNHHHRGPHGPFFLWLYILHYIFFFAWILKWWLVFLVQLDLPFSIKIEEGNLEVPYKALQLHLHWGKDGQLGSEHVIDGEQFPMEVWNMGMEMFHNQHCML